MDSGFQGLGVQYLRSSRAQGFCSVAKGFRGLGIQGSLGVQSLRVLGGSGFGSIKVLFSGHPLGIGR